MKTMIIGSGLSGKAVYEYLQSKNEECFFAEKEIVDNENIDELIVQKLLSDVDRVIVSPGISLQKSIIFQIKKRKIALFGELEFGARCINNDIIAVTGTNGKTTVVSLINHLLRGYAGGCALGGNIGTPVTSLIKKITEQNIVILECSSFQLETVEKFHPHISVILNIAEDHLNRHRTMKEYLRCKYKITKNQTKSDYLLLNFDDDILKNNPPKTRANLFYFSTKQKVKGVYLKGKSIWFFDGEKSEKLVSVSKIKLKGEHNLSNILASVLSVYLQTKNKEILKEISFFEGVEHRIEFVKNINGVEFFNDSKATNIASTLVSCNSFKKSINLILGGSDKGLSFDELFQKLPKNVKNIAIIGENWKKIAFSAKTHNYSNYVICEKLGEAVKHLFDIAKRGDVVLLSPASASFDQFANFEERGRYFKKIVEKLYYKESKL